MQRSARRDRSGRWWPPRPRVGIGSLVRYGLARCSPFSNDQVASRGGDRLDGLVIEAIIRDNKVCSIERGQEHGAGAPELRAVREHNRVGSDLNDGCLLYTS